MKDVLKAFYKYGFRGFNYLWMRYVVAVRILSYPKPLEKPETRHDLSMHMLSGSRDFVMALWSLASYYRVSQAIGTLYFHSDGTLNEVEREILMRLYPSATYVDARDTLAAHKTFFDAHPALREFRATYPKFQCKKLLDPYLASDKPMRLILDSDMLWFRNPVEIVDAVNAGVPKALMMSNQDAHIHVTFKDGSQTSDQIARANSGIVLYRKEQFSLAMFEAYLSKCDYLGRKFTDQACYATILNPTLLPGDRYLIKGTLTDAVVMRHYTNPQRPKFFFYGLDRVWREILK